MNDMPRETIVQGLDLLDIVSYISRKNKKFQAIVLSEVEEVLDKEVAVYKYNGEWTELETNEIKKDSLYYYYKTETRGFSNFAIVIREMSEEPVVGYPGQINDLKVPLKQFILIFLLIKIIILAVVALHFYKRKK